MKPVTVGRYDAPDQVDGAPFVGVVSTEDWVLFEQADGTLMLWAAREPSGAVIGEPAVVRR